MAPVKFDDNLKKTLERRTITPSGNAWNKLENRLDKHTEQRSTKRFWMLGLAASIVGVLLVTTLFFKSEENLINNEIKIVQEIPTIEVNKKDETSIAVEDKNEKTHFKKENPVVEPKSIIAQKTDTEKNPELPKRVFEQSVIEDVATVSENALQEEKIKSFEDVKVDEMVAQVQELIGKNQSVTEQEIDSLLEIAQQEINQKKIYNEAAGTVDAMALLRGVENDLDKSFRNKVLEALVSSVENVATAVAQRNN